MEIFAAVALFLAVSGWFWVILGVVAAFFLGAVSDERGWMSTITLLILGTLAAVRWPATLDFVSDPVNLAIVAASYVTIGVIWARFQWGKHVQSKVEFFTAIRDKYLKQNELPANYFKTEPSVEHVEQYIEHVKQHIGRFSYSDTKYARTISELHASITPSASTNKAAIVMWMGYWPFSFTFYILRDLLADLFNSVYQAIGGQFQKVADRKFEQL